MHHYWVDIFNGPHVHFFQNVCSFIAQPLLTARNYRPIPQLLDLYHIPARILGVHGGESSFDKLKASTLRILDLAQYIQHHTIDILLHKHSVEAARVAWGLSIPSIAFIDNELMAPQNMLVCPLSQVLIAPIAIDQYALRNFTPSHVALLQYDGVSEVANVSGFKADESVLKTLNLTTARPIVVIRGEPLLASYHKKRKTLAEQLIKKIHSDIQDVQIVRLEREGELTDPQGPVIDARSLCCVADLVISGGGTMTREAALLGANAISYFDHPLAVDRYLMQKGLLQCCPGEEILTVDFKTEITRKRKQVRLDQFEHPFEMIGKAEKILFMKRPAPKNGRNVVFLDLVPSQRNPVR